MKLKNNLFILLLTVWAVLTSHAQTPQETKGQVIINNVDLYQAGNELHLTFDIKVQQKALHNRQDWRIIPELYITGQDSLLFPVMLINGRQKDRHFRRKVNFENEWLLSNYPTYKVRIPHDVDNIVRYETVIPFQEWMYQASLRINQYLTSPREEKELFTLDNFGTIRLEAREPYLPEARVNYIVPEKKEKRLDLNASAYLEFPVGKTHIIEDFRRNPVELEKIHRDFSKIINKDFITIQSVSLHGYASPEGSYPLNERLARERTEAFKNYLTRAFGIPAGQIETAYTPEDWEGLHRLVESGTYDIRAAGIPETGTPGSPQEAARMESTLRRHPQWTLIRDKLFPQLRRTEYTINFHVRDFTVKEARELIASDPGLFSHLDFYTLAMSYPTGDIGRLETFEKAVTYFPGDIVALVNYVAALIEYGELLTALRYIEKVRNTPEIMNNSGVYYLLTGQLDSASDCLLQAEKAGIPQATHNLQELARKHLDNMEMEKRIKN